MIINIYIRIESFCRCGLIPYWSLLGLYVTLYVVLDGFLFLTNCIETQRDGYNQN
jgi:hypothetical protein